MIDFDINLWAVFFGRDMSRPETREADHSDSDGRTDAKHVVRGR